MKKAIRRTNKESGHKKQMIKKRILIIAAHPDDEVLGCGGAIARFIKEGAEAFVLLLGEGVTARDVSFNGNGQTHSKEIDRLKSEALKANSVLGVQKVYFRDLPDNRFDSVPLLDIVKIIEEIKREIRPNTIFTHYEHDLNIDHQITYKAVLTATRPLVGESVKEIYSFEALSSTEWGYPISFSPDTFVDIQKSIYTKVKALAMYKSELNVFPHPRSLEGLKLNAKCWGMKAGLRYAEAFKTIRVIT